MRDLIRAAMERERERRYVFGELVKSTENIKAGRLISSETVATRSAEEIAALRRAVLG